jgi:hypothetical protein
MAVLSDVAFEAYFNDATTGTYRDGQGTASINPLKHRNLVTNVKDSFHNTARLNLVSIDPTISPVFQFSSINTDWHFSAVIGAAYTWTLSNNTYAYKFTFLFEISGGLYVQTFPSSFIMNDVRWDSGAKTWTPQEEGKYKAEAWFDGTNWFLDISQSIYQ